MICHDRAAKLEGRPKRNWSEERFLCAACIVKAQNKRPRRGRKAKDVVATDPGDVTMNAPQALTGDDVAMSIFQPTDVPFSPDPTLLTLQLPLFSSGTSPLKPSKHSGISDSMQEDGVPSAEQQLETPVQPQDVLGPNTHSSLPQKMEQNMAQNSPGPALYSGQPAMAQKAVSSHSQGDPRSESAQVAPQISQFDGYRQVHPNQWHIPAIPLNGVMPNGLPYPNSLPPLAPHRHPHPIIDVNGPPYQSTQNPQSVYRQPTAPS